MQVSPPDGSRDLAPDQHIEILFDEMVDPVSVPGSIVFSPELEFTTRVRGRRVAIRPDQPFETGQTYVLTLQRGIRDFRKNSMPASWQFVFSAGGEIATGLITGSIAEADSTRPVEVGLFALSDTSARYELLRSVDLANDGSFSFAYLQHGQYRVAAVEGGLSDFPQGINRRPYALPCREQLVIREDTITVLMRLSAPLFQPQISMVEWVTPTFLNVTFSSPFGEAPVPAGLFPTRQTGVYGYVVTSPDSDTTAIDLGLAHTQLGETYLIEPFSVPTQAPVDTLPPVLALARGRVPLKLTFADRGRFITGARGLITFSEPVHTPDSLALDLSGRDSAQVVLQPVSPFSLEFTLAEPERFTRGSFSGAGITDYAGNTVADSLLSITLAFEARPAAGQLRGTVLGVSGSVVVGALTRENHQRVASTVTDSARYFLDGLAPGFYHIFAHQQIGPDALSYYSGRWEPYQGAAPFGEYFEPVEVRARWEVDGIDINFNAGIFEAAQEAPVDRKD